MFKGPIRIEEYSLPEGSYNTQCTLKSFWSDDEVLADPELIKNASDSLKAMFLTNIITHVEEEFKDLC